MVVELDDAMPDGWKVWLDWQKVVAPDNRPEIEALEADRGDYLGYVRVVGRRRSDVMLEDRIESLPPQYSKQVLLRSEVE